MPSVAETAEGTTLALRVAGDSLQSLALPTEAPPTQPTVRKPAPRIRTEVGSVAPRLSL